MTHERRKRRADGTSLKLLKRKVQASGSAEQIVGQPTLDEVPETMSSSSIDHANKSHQPLSRTDSTSTYQADEDKETSPMISRYAILRKSCMRSKRFVWTCESDRYYYFRLPMLGLKIDF